MSPRAAAQLETLGFTEVFDYVGGKADWRAGGMNIEGTASDQLTVKAVLSTDDVIVSASDLLGDIRAKVRLAEGDAAIVTTSDGTVLGRIRGKNLSKEDSLTAEQAMRSGPSTIRPDMELDSAVEWMESAGIRSVLVTTPEGRLLGTLYLENAVKLANAS